MELVNELNTRLKLCIKWFQKRDEANVDEQGKLRNTLESSEKKCADMGNVVSPCISANNVFH